MPFPPAKPKKPEAGAPKPKSAPPDLSGPGPLDAPPPGPEETAPDPDPAGESGEESPGVDLMSDAIKPLMDLGLSDADAKDTLAGMFESMARCIRGKEPASEGADDMGMDMGGPPMPPMPGGGNPYGR
jgi:hypothetical protein